MGTKKYIPGNHSEDHPELQTRKTSKETPCRNRVKESGPKSRVGKKSKSLR